MAVSHLGVYALPLGWALFVWWLSTGAIIYLDNLPRRTHRWSMLGATVLLAWSLHGLHSGSTDATVSGAYAAFTYGLLIWGWQEMSFFMGFITGPSRAPCPAECTGWERFVRAVKACLYHELASLVSAVAVIAATHGGVNQVGTWTFLILWWMRLSSKFNVFLGVRNLSEEFIPDHLAFIRSFLRQRPMNLLFPFSVTVPMVVVIMLVQQTAAPETSAFAATGGTLLTVLLVLAIIEHWFLVLPVPAAALWNWSVRARQNRRAAADEKLAVKLALGPRRRGRLSWRVGLPGAPLAQLPRLAPASVRMGEKKTLGGER